MNSSDHATNVRHLFAQVRDLPTGARHARLRELGADPLVIAEVDAWIAADAATSALDGAPADGDGVRTELGVDDELGAWRLVRELGAGGMGAVYLAERVDGHFDQQAAIKLIRGIPAAETFVHFARERQILATLRHPGIARLLDGGATPGGQPYLVMEYVDGIAVDAFCRQHGLDLGARLRLFLRICDAVQYAHARLVVHCDLKPSNVLVRDDGHPVLLDFGVARALDRVPSASEARSVSAWITPRYASPEQLRREPVSTASDVFSLGLILFELLTGRSARLDTDDHTITLLGRAAVRPSELAGEVAWGGRLRGDLDAIVQRATASDAGDRYESAEAMAADIERHLAHRPVLARAPSLAYLGGRLLRRRWPVAVAAVVLIASAAVFTWRLAAERDRALAAEREATVQAATAERVSAFLVSVFNVSNPKLNAAREISARAVLDEGAARIEGELVDAPRVKAKLLDVLGSAYRSIGEPAKAVALFRQAIDVYSGPAVDLPLAAAATWSQLAVVYSNNKYATSDAQSAARESLRLREQHAGADSLDMADALNTLGVVLEADDRFDEAEALLRRAMEIRRARLGASSLQVATTTHNLALVVEGRGDPAAAAQLFEEALAIKRAAVGERHPDYQNSLANYASALGHSGRREEAAAALRRNLELAIELYGEESNHVAIAHNELGSMLHDLGRFTAAADEYRRALALRERLDGKGSANTALPLNNLASAYEDMGDIGAALPLFRESLAMRRSTQDPGSAMILRAENNLARALTGSGRLEEALPLIESVSGALRARHGEAHVNTARIEAIHVDALLRAGRIDEAAAVRARMAQPADAKDRRWTALLAITDARLANRRENAGMALATAQSAWEAMRALWGEQHPLIVEAGVLYAEALRRNEQSADARALIERIRPLAESSLVASSPLRQRVVAWR